MTGIEVASEKLYDAFRRYASRPFIFVMPGGNAGDFLIYKGAEKLARLAGIEFESLSHNEFMGREFGSDVVVYLHGSGGYNPIWSGTPLFELEKAASHKGVVIQGPSTFWDDLAFLREKVANVVVDASCEKLIIMSRERVSYDLLANPARAVQRISEFVGLGSDVRINADDILPRKQSGAAREDWREAYLKGIDSLVPDTGERDSRQEAETIFRRLIGKLGR